MSAKSLHPFRMERSDRRRYQVGSMVTVAHPKQSPAPLSVPHFVSKPRYLTERLHFGKQLHHRGSHLFDVTKPHANVEPIQDRAGSLRYRPPYDAAEPIGAVFRVSLVKDADKYERDSVYCLGVTNSRDCS